MRLRIRVVLAGLFCMATACSVVSWLASGNSVTRQRPSHRARSRGARQRTAAGEAAQQDLGKQEARPEFYVVRAEFEDGGFGTAFPFTGPIRDPGSLQELREAVRGRGRRGIAALRAKYNRLGLDVPSTRQQVDDRLKLEKSIGLLYMYEGRFTEATAWIEKVLTPSRGDAPVGPDRPDGCTGNHRHAPGRDRELPGVRRPVELHLPDRPRGRSSEPGGLARGRPVVHRLPRRVAAGPAGHLAVEHRLHDAGRVPRQGPAAIPDPDRPVPLKLDVGRFENVAPLVGLGARGPNLAGGSIFDDFNGDGLPDLFTTSLDADLGASLFINRGDGTFEDRSATAGLGDQIYALNVTRADFDNDGNLDVLLLRGRLGEPAAALAPAEQRGRGLRGRDDRQRAGRADRDPSRPPGATMTTTVGSTCSSAANISRPRATSRRPGTIPATAAGCITTAAMARSSMSPPQAGVVDERCAKGSAWGDYDGDGRLDLFVSNMRQECRLYHNEGGGKFRDVAPELGVTGPSYSFACWFWDFDNDGLLDLFVNDYRARVAEVVTSSLGVAIEGVEPPPALPQPRPAGFRDVTERSWARPGDVADGLELRRHRQRRLPRLLPGDRRPCRMSGLVPNLHVQECRGRMSSRTSPPRRAPATFRKGTAFRSPIGTATAISTCLSRSVVQRPGTRPTMLLFQNPCHGRHWLKVKLVGTKTNRAALGAKIRVDLKGPDGESARSTARSATTPASAATAWSRRSACSTRRRVAELTVSWPTSQTTQTFRDLAADQAIEITEGSESFKVLHQPTLTIPRQ